MQHPDQKNNYPQWIKDAIEAQESILKEKKFQNELPQPIQVILAHCRAMYVALDKGAIQIQTNLEECQGDEFIVTVFGDGNIEDVFQSPV